MPEAVRVGRDAGALTDPLDQVREAVPGERERLALTAGQMAK